jgi:hypothetical protein
LAVAAGGSAAPAVARSFRTHRGQAKNDGRSVLAHLLSHESRNMPDFYRAPPSWQLHVEVGEGRSLPTRLSRLARPDKIRDLSEASAIQYAVLVLNVANIVVCGPSEYGATKAVMANNIPARDSNRCTTRMRFVPVGTRGRSSMYWCNLRLGVLRDRP